MSRMVAAELVTVDAAAADNTACVPESETIRVMNGRAVFSTTNPGDSPAVSEKVTVEEPEVVEIVRKATSVSDQSANR